MMVKVTVDKGTCIGCGACVGACGEVFEFDKDHKSQPKKASYPKEGCIMHAAQGCPVSAIHVTIDGKKKI